jgi:hypothetical protein
VFLRSYAPIVLVLDGATALIVLAVLLPPARARRLVREGTLAVGTLIDSRCFTGKGATNYLRYQFKTADGGVLTKIISVSRAAYEAARMGMAVTVLYDPMRPKRSLAYEYCDYEVVPRIASQRQIDAPPQGSKIGSEVPADPEVLRLAKAGRGVEAIKRYRSITGAGLKEAKDFVERL